MENYYNSQNIECLKYIDISKVDNKEKNIIKKALLNYKIIKNKKLNKNSNFYKDFSCSKIFNKNIEFLNKK